MPWLTTANHTADGESNTWTIDRADIGAQSGAPPHHLLFQANGGTAPDFYAPIYVHVFSP